MATVGVLVAAVALLGGGHSRGAPSGAPPAVATGPRPPAGPRGQEPPPGAGAETPPTPPAGSPGNGSGELGGLWPAPWGWGAPVGAMAVAYAALGGAVLVGLRQRALQIRKRRRRREPGRRFCRVTPPGPPSPYGNVLCPTAAPRPPPELGSPTAGPPGDVWGRAPRRDEEEEEEEEEGGYEQPDSESEGPGEGYENEPGPPQTHMGADGGSEASADGGSYENMEGTRGGALG